MPNTVTWTDNERSSKLLHQHKIVQKKKNTENYNMLISFLRQTDKFISTGVLPSQKFWQWGDDINTKDDITPFDGMTYEWTSSIDSSLLAVKFSYFSVQI